MNFPRFLVVGILLAYAASAVAQEEAPAAEADAVIDTVEQTATEVADETPAEEPPVEQPEPAEQEPSASEDPIAEQPSETAEEPVVTAEATEQEAAEAVPETGEEDAEEAVAEDEVEDDDDDLEEETDWEGLVERFPALGAVMHRAAVHMPIALWLFGALFVLVGVIFPKWRNQIPVTCLVIGSLCAVAAAMTGWWNAEHEWGTPWEWGDEFSLEEDLDKHRWAGVGLAAASLVLSLLALISQAKKSKALGFIWRVGLLLLAAAVAWEGHLGGEISIGSEYLEEAVEAWLNP